MCLYSYQQIALSVITKAETQSDDNDTSIRYYVTDGLYRKISEIGLNFCEKHKSSNLCQC